MQNYHTHKSFSNCNTSFKDSAMGYEDYAKRAAELGQQVLTCVDHGTQGNYLRCWQTAQKYKLHFVYGVEAYWVNDRHVRENFADGTNAHIVILAQNHAGIREINRILSIANRDGFYRVPRVDLELLRQLTPNNVFVTTACVAFWGKVAKDGKLNWHYAEPERNDSANIDRLFCELHRHFGESLSLEVQYHNTGWQKELNKHILELHYRYKVPLIAGLDSHYIYPEHREERKWLREESGVSMHDDDHEFDEQVYEDYPDEETVLQRFRAQGVLTESEIREAVDNTDILLMFDSIHFDRSRKLPSIYPQLTQEEKNELYLKKVWGAWNEQKEAILENARYLRNVYINEYGMTPDEVPEPTAERYEEAIRYETNIVTSTGVADYFLLDAEMIRRGVEKGGHVTPSGRGSASSFFTNTLLGFSTIDRLSLPVRLYPERFVTKDRLMSSLPDIDMNVSDREPFAQAQDELLTEACGSSGHAYPMIAYGTLKYKSAFRLYARAKNLNMDEVALVSKQIEEYERAVKEADSDDERSAIQIDDYVDVQYMPYIEGSSPYRGIVVSKSQAPSAFLLYNGDIESEIGIMRVNAKGGKQVVYCTVIDGYTAEDFGYVKNDILIVKVIKINAAAMRRAGLPMLSSQEVIRRTIGDNKTWEVFANGWTQGINQCQGAGTTEKLRQYKPKQLRDLAAFVAAIRPGFKSQLNLFLARNPFDYGVPAFDSILKNDSTHSSWMIYQENAMSALSLAGFDLERTYPIIKAISKKKSSVINAAQGEFEHGFARYLTDEQGVSPNEARTQTQLVWSVIRDSAAYSFNASHAVCVSIDALYGAYLKAHYPIAYYTTLLEEYASDKDKLSQIKSEMNRAFGIRITTPKFRQDNRGYFVDEKRMQISDSLTSVKFVSRDAAECLYQMRDRSYSSFVDLLYDLLQYSCINTKVRSILIMMDYFSEFGKRKKLITLADEFTDGKNRVTKSLKEATQVKRMAALRELEAELEDADVDPLEVIDFEFKHYGQPVSRTDHYGSAYYVLEVNSKYTPKLTLYSLRTGVTNTVKTHKNTFELCPVEAGDAIRIVSSKKRPIVKYHNGEKHIVDGVFEWWALAYEVIPTKEREVKHE